MKVIKCILFVFGFVAIGVISESYFGITSPAYYMAAGAIYMAVMTALGGGFSRNSDQFGDVTGMMANRTFMYSIPRCDRTPGLAILAGGWDFNQQGVEVEQ